MSVHYLILGIFARVYGNPTDAGGSSVMRLVFGMCRSLCNLQRFPPSSCMPFTFPPRHAGIAFGLSGLGYGMGLTLFPTALSECYGQRNWRLVFALHCMLPSSSLILLSSLLSVFMSYLQFGSAGLSLSLPPVATAIINSTGG